MENSGKILLICDDANYSGYIKDELLGLGNYFVFAEYSAQEGISNLKQNSYEMIFIKYGLPQVDIASLINELKKIDSDSVIVVLYDPGQEDKIKELNELGIFDFLSQPVNKEKLKFIVEKGTRLHVLLVATHKFSQGLKENNQALEKQNILLAKRVEEATTNLSRLYENLRSTYMRTIKVLAQAIDARDHYTHSHSENVSHYAVAIANHLRLPTKEVEILRQACELHDLGKIGIEDSILLKPSALTAQEWEQIRKHPTIGAQILEPLTFLNGVVDLVRQHHEHYDGTGYPEGRKGDDILLGARIIHVADAYEAMRSARSYRKVPLTKEEAVLEVKRNSGTQFDPKIVEAFLQVVDNL
ncbi:MAG: HD domain-containing protein [Candidatus Omnitrophica bacterium]|jgi:putative nucleotidyltransferase with HDIG domain|nr:HD domain-containing protein [Candidatus Omnitrophota bacterium]MDD5660949.1 HD domain-containing protein [Candidatus Omnitrophota bacterium]